MGFLKSKQVPGWIFISIYFVSGKSEIVFVETQSLIQEKTIAGKENPLNRKKTLWECPKSNQNLFYTAKSATWG